MIFSTASVYVKMKKPKAAIRDANAALEVSIFSLYLIKNVISLLPMVHTLYTWLYMLLDNF